jgi:ribosomal protein S18 acetylase RimI-like enzyme
VFAAANTATRKHSIMSGLIQTREFTIDDYNATLELWQRFEESVEICEGDDKESVAAFLKRNPGLSRVAIHERSIMEPAGAERHGRESPRGLMSSEVNQSIVGVALCGHDGRRGHIYHLAVDPGYQGRRLGKRLVDECLEGLRKAGLKRAIIMVADDNPRGREFWKRCGWEELPGAIGMGIDL